MQCDTYQLWLSAYLDGELAATDLRALERHLDSCAACTGELETLRGSVRLLRGLPPEDPPAHLRPRIMAAIAASRPSTWSRLAALFRLPAPVPAWGFAGTGLAAALVVGAYCFRPAPEAPHPGVASRQPSVARRVQEPRAPVSKRSGERKRPPVVIAGIPRAATVPEPAPEASPITLRSQPPASRLAKAGETPRQPRVALVPTRNPRRGNREESRQPLKPAPRRTGPPVSGPTSASGMDGFESPTPRVSPTPPVTPPIDTLPEEPMTMMASMPMVSSGMPMEPTPGSDDALSSLRERLAEQRREVPTPAVDAPVSRRDARTLPVRIEF